METWDVSCQGRYPAALKAPHLGSWAGTRPTTSEHRKDSNADKAPMTTPRHSAGALPSWQDTLTWGLWRLGMSPARVATQRPSRRLTWAAGQGQGQQHQNTGRTATPAKPQRPRPAIWRVRCLRGRTPSPGVYGDLGRLLPGLLLGDPQGASPGQLGRDKANNNRTQ